MILWDPFDWNNFSSFHFLSPNFLSKSARTDRYIDIDFSFLCTICRFDSIDVFVIYFLYYLLLDDVALRVGALDDVALRVLGALALAGVLPYDVVPRFLFIPFIDLSTILIV